ncbi:N-formylglutamate amidohydrolase [Sphingomonas sp. Leaf34]|jgi:predicted N-formylglutamate amidohydrolase|uniref:N-formylglutamate amidohydrolase n=1 Tax=Sphingomonas sp. Leaf34 TaxID=1736216 RepID=UPI0006F586F0|nr:N-formylglutamate amidohydrolase [Sphingomonas sp. Leaf34]KQN27970.1 N-formylglutamate amidohydrolase [Sphingomonas sp. Leaf34]
MNSTASQSLLGTEDAAPVMVVNPKGASSFLLIGDHAGNAVPQALGSLGLSDTDLSRHIGWDIGIGELGALLAERLDAVFVRQTYSRLVIDCNRSPSQPDLIAEVSDATVVPGNAALDDAARAARFAEIHTPYQAAIADEIARRDAAGMATVLVALHSFTPAMQGALRDQDRPWHIGILHDGGDTAFAHALLDVLRQEADLVVGDNQPYRMDLIDYTIPRHAYPERRPYAEIEVRQDLLGSTDGCSAWADRLARLLPDALAKV